MVDLVATKPPVISAARASDLGTVTALFRAYAEWLDYAICFDGFEKELRELPGDFVPPAGGLWLAQIGGEAAGVIALRRKAAGVGEVKRLWVAPAWRGQELGRLLIETAVAAARQGAYQRIYLETLAQMRSARALYAELGFVEISGEQPDGKIEMALEL